MKRMVLTVILFVSFILINANQSYAFSEKLAEEVNNKSKNVTENIFPEGEYIEVERKVCIGVFDCTGYCACSACCGSSTGITASGTHVQSNHTIAADTSRLPFGTKVYIDDVEYTVEDTGGAIRGNRIDIYFDSHQSALLYGRRRKEVYIMETVKFNRIDFVEYMNLTGDLLNKKQISLKESTTQTKELEWLDKDGTVIVKRIKNNDGTFYNYCDENVYKTWLKNLK